MDATALDDHSRLPKSLPIDQVISNLHECSYLPGRQACLPLHLPQRLVNSTELDWALGQGVRRSGVFMYYTACGSCTACEPSRVEVSTFRWSDSFRRVRNRGDRELSMTIATPSLDNARLALFNRHRSHRQLGSADTAYGESDYESFLVDTCCERTLELSFRHGEVLVAVSIIDAGRTSLSAVYTYFDPAYSKLSLGTYSILKQIEFAQVSGRRYVYLGMYVADNQHLNYKARFTPQERWIDGQWVRFE